MPKPSNFSTHHTNSIAGAADAPAEQRLLYNRAGHKWTFRWDDASFPILLSAINDLSDRADAPLDRLDASIITCILKQEHASISPTTVQSPSARAR